jgi:hypothetical protein
MFRSTSVVCGHPIAAGSREQRADAIGLIHARIKRRPGRLLKAMGLPVLASIGDDDQPFHEHDWPANADGWDALVGCRTCGLRLLTGFLGIAS